MKVALVFCGFCLVLVGATIRAAAADDRSSAACGSQSPPVPGAQQYDLNSAAKCPGIMLPANPHLFSPDHLLPISAGHVAKFLHLVQAERSITIGPAEARMTAGFRDAEITSGTDLRERCALTAPEAELSFNILLASESVAAYNDPSAGSGDEVDNDGNIQPSLQAKPSGPADFNQEIYYRNKLEFSLEGGWHPINVPFPLDIFVGDAYNTYPLKYTLVPVFASLRWHVGNIWGPKILRGNFDFTFTGSITGVARGPENHYFAYLMGIRRNFVPRNSRVAPFFDIRLGVGRIDAKGPLGVLYAQGQDVTFTINMGSGVRYNFSPRYSISGGINYTHISNLDLSESNGKPNWGVRNYGINVYGPMVGLNIQLRTHSPHSE